MKKTRFFLTSAAVLLFSGAAMAEGIGIGARVGTQGLGLQLGTGISDAFTLRLDLNAFKYSYDTTEEDVDYESTTELRSIGLLADWYPFGGTFRLTGGIYNNGNQVDLEGRPSGDTYTFNGTTYQSSDIGTLNGTIRYDKKIAPYLGLGWGHLGGKSGFNFSADVGVMFTGSANVELTGTCGPDVPTDTCTQLQADLEAEEASVQESSDKLKIYPVISLGVGYTF